VSSFVHSKCVCGVDIIAVSNDEDDVRIAVASHNDLAKAQGMAGRGGDEATGEAGSLRLQGCY